MRVGEVMRRRAGSLSARRAWIEISYTFRTPRRSKVALRKESVDRNRALDDMAQARIVALRKESVDRNTSEKEAMEWALGRSPQGERG